MQKAPYLNFKLGFFNGEVVEGYWCKFVTHNTTVDAAADDPDGYYRVSVKLPTSPLGWAVVGNILRSDNMCEDYWEAYAIKGDLPFPGEQLVQENCQLAAPEDRQFKDLDTAIWLIIDNFNERRKEHQAKQSKGQSCIKKS